MQPSLWSLIGQVGIIVAAAAVMILGIMGLWYGLSFAVLTAVGRVFPLRGTWTPADYDPTGGPLWALKTRPWTMTGEEVRQARGRLSSHDRDERDRACAAQGHAWTDGGPAYCGRCFACGPDPLEPVAPRAGDGP